MCVKLGLCILTSEYLLVVALLESKMLRNVFGTKRCVTDRCRDVQNLIFPVLYYQPNNVKLIKLRRVDRVWDVVLGRQFNFGRTD
jgi:hypothetical protein